jgi:UDP-N-acetylglucosamine acyltransferase
MQDTPPFVLAAGNPCRPIGINVEGLKRRGFSPEDIAALREAYKTLFRRGLSLEQARSVLQETLVKEPGVARHLQLLLDFVSVSGRGIIRP